MSSEIEWYELTKRVVHQPGNGTRYEAIGVKMPKGIPDLDSCWLIYFPLIGAAHCFRSGAYTTVGYVREKFEFNTKGVRMNEVDLHEMTKCISIITGGKHNAATDSKGCFPSDYILRIAQSS